MDESETQAQLRREATDASLRVERHKTDEELAKQQADVEGDASKVLDGARARADEVLRSAREKADKELQRTEADSDDFTVVEDERSREDDAVRRERATADEEFSREPDANRRAVAALLELARAQTDYHLHRERRHTDGAIGSRDDFLAMVSHELQNMLGGVAISAGALMKIPGNDEVRDAVARHTRRIQRNTARMNRLVGDLIDVVSIDAGRLAVAPESRDATELVGETLEAFEPIATARKISIGTRVAAGPLLARYDRGRILQALANLVGNALKFTKDGGRIDIVVESLEGRVQFAVIDSGVGIAPEQLSVVFDRFWQVTNLERPGLGLGLYITRGIVDAHGGRIWVDSRLDVGSTFYFTLPVA